MRFETGVIEGIEKLRQKDTDPAYNPDTDSLEAISDKLDCLQLAGPVDVGSISGVAVTSPDDFKADVSALSTAAALTAHDAKLDTKLNKTDYTAPDNAGIAAIKAKTDKLPVTPASQGDVTAVSTKVDTVDTVVDAIKLKTDNLPSDPADQSLIESAITSSANAIRGADSDTLKTISDQIDALATVGGGTNVSSIGGVAVTGPNDLKADVSALALEATLAAIKGAGWNTQTLVALKSAIDSRLASASYTAPDNTGIAAIKAKTDGLNYSSANVQARVADKGVLNDLSSANVTAACTSSLNTYDPPTKSELDEAVSGIHGGAESLGTVAQRLDEELDLMRSEQSGTLTMTGSEQTLYADSGQYAYRSMGGCIDLSNMQAGDVLSLRVYVIIKSGGGYVLEDAYAFNGAQASPLIEIDPQVNRWGIKVTAQQTVGTKRALDHEWFVAKRGA